LSNGRREMWDYFIDMEVVPFLNTIAFYKAKQDYERFIIEANRRKNAFK
jgi:hypothetical protein